MKKTIIILLFVVVNLFHAVAGGIETKDLKLFREGDKVVLSFSAYIPEKTVKTDRRIIVTPQLYNTNDSATMDLFAITGKKMAKREKQKKRLKKDTSAPLYPSAANGSTMLYAASVPYEAWMNNALSLRLQIEEEGCCEVKDLGVILVTGSIDLPLPYTPSTMAVLPLPSEVTRKTDIYPFLRMLDKDGEGDRSTSVRFRVSNSRLDLAFSSNAENVEKIKEGIRLVNSDERTRLEKITISGFASPEGTRQHNLELSRNRANALSQYLQKEMGLPATIFTIQAGGEDWEGLLALVEKSDMQYKEEIIKIITQQPADKRNNMLKQLGGGRPYQSIYDVLYPQLRDACYINVWYSEKKDEVADVINNAITLIASQRYDEALNSLLTVEADPRSWNVTGTCYMLKGDYPQARTWLQKAIDAGDKEAEQNLKLIN